MSSMPTTDETANSLPAAAVAGFVTDSPPQTAVSVVPSSTPPIQPGSSTHVHPTAALPLDGALSTPILESITRLQDDNWLAWKTRVSVVLQCHGLFHLVTGSEPPPSRSSSSTDASADARPSWHARDLVARALIVCTLSDRQLVHVLDCPTAACIWRTLVTMHEPETWSPRARVALERRLYTTCAPEGADVPAHLDAMWTWWRRLGGAGRTIGDAEFAGILLDSLPPSWRAFTVGWHFRLKDTTARGVSVPEIVAVLNGEYRRRKAVAEGAVGGRITYAVGGEGSRGRSKESKVKCDRCSKFGHADKDCWYNPANRGKGRVNKGSGRGAGKDRTKVRQVMSSSSDDD